MDSAPVFNKVSDEQVKQSYFISLANLGQNPLFEKSADSTFQAASGQHKVIVKTNPFQNKKAAQAFLLGRRTYLHQAYSTLIAPYFGVVNADPECMKLVNVAGDLKKSKDSEQVSLTFAASESGQLVDCYSEKPQSTVKYLLKLCYKNNSVYEVKVLNKIGAVEPDVSAECN